MTDRELWSERESIASGAEFATDLWLSHLCTAASPQCVPDATAQWQCHGYTDGQDGAWCASVGTENCWEYGVNDQSEEMSSCGPCYCCRRKVKTAPTGTDTRHTSASFLKKTIFVLLCSSAFRVFVLSQLSRLE